MTGPSGSPRLRWMLLLLGALGVVVLAAALAPYAMYVARAPGPHGGGITPMLGMVVLIALCGANVLRARRGKPPLVTSGEALAVFFIIVAGCWAVGWGFMETIMPLLTAPIVMAASQAGWAEHVLPRLPAWALGPQTEPYASGFYQGLEKGVAAPLSLWLRPGLVWGGMAVAVTMLSVGLAGIFARKWIVHDRLSFPHAEVISGVVRGFVSSKLFWYGVALAAIIPVWNTTQRFFPLFQRISPYFTGDNNGVAWMTGMPALAFPIDFGMIGLLFFVQRDIILSVVAFFFLISVEGRLLSLGGVEFANNETYYFSGGPVDWQATGALVIFVLAGIWKGRAFLRAYIKSALEGDDGGSWLSPRVTVGCLLVGGIAVAGWMFAQGLGAVGLPSMVFSQLVSFIGSSRIVAESGMGGNLNVDPGSLTVALAGTKSLGANGSIAIVLSYWAAVTGGCMLVFTMQGEKLNSESRFPRGTLAGALLAVLLGVAVTAIATAALAYSRGAITFASPWTYTWHPRMLYDMAVAQMTQDPAKAGPDLLRWGWMAGGGALMGALVFLRANVVGWFLHPVGFLLGHQAMGTPGANGATPWVFIGLVALLVKTVMLKLGGVESYERAKPFFAGMVIGSALPGFYNLLVNLIAGPPLT